MPRGVYKRTKIRRSKKVKRICKICNRDFFVLPSVVKIGSGNCCCRACFVILHKGQMTGANNPSWKGGIVFDKDGYSMILKPSHPHAKKSGYVYEHRLIMEQYLGRYLKPKEVVHHINSNPSDNRISNLILFENNSEHRRYHGK